MRREFNEIEAYPWSALRDAASAIVKWPLIAVGIQNDPGESLDFKGYSAAVMAAQAGRW